MTSLQDQFDNPLVRDSELHENSTHYERLVAAPSDEALFQMWSAWSISLYTFALFNTIVLVALLATKTVRERAFNLFLIYLMIPDTIAMWLCGSSCLANALAGYFTSMEHCKFQSFYITFSVGANAWLNAAITRHVLEMLQSAKQFQKYQPPPCRRVTLEAMVIYLYTAFLASWFLIDQDWWPFKTRLSTGVVCIPQDYDTRSTIFLYCIFLPLWFLIPLAYVCYAGLVIWRQKLLPKRGKRRTLAVYFFRLILVFLVMWIPCLVLLFVTSPWTHPWVQWAGGLWGHLQGAVSGIMGLAKPDIWKAFVKFYRPKCCENQSSEDNLEEWDATSFNSKISYTNSTSFMSISSPWNFFSTAKHKRAPATEVSGLRSDLAYWEEEARKDQQDHKRRGTGSQYSIDWDDNSDIGQSAITDQQAQRVLFGGNGLENNGVTITIDRSSRVFNHDDTLDDETSSFSDDQANNLSEPAAALNKVSDMDISC